MSAFAVLARSRLASSSLLSVSQSHCRHTAVRQAAAAAQQQQQLRFYAKPVKKNKGKEKASDDAPSSSSGKHNKKLSTDELIPASQRIVASTEYKNA